MAHWAQWVRNRKFQMYDYGTEGNMLHYNQSTPPEYVLDVIPKSFSIALFYGDADELADPVDVKTMIAGLPNPPVFVKELPNYAHLDFCWDITANVDMYVDVIKLLKAAGQ
eukprot:TRINITY_DN369_c0_g1_i2.p1 TRINITY_DN369_c0_g1~~TRINITY_DN369_c0_g1_i2.p1  ORF type:complete len:129 (+),score=23.16 TRINITY_DN369_c0_g1_i2:56-388(+)